MWNQEIIYSYPNSLSFYPKTWIKELQALTEKELYAIDCQFSYEALSGEMKAIFLKRAELSKIEKINYASGIKELPGWAYMKVKEKKKHEVSRLIPLLSEHCQKHNIKQIFDLGGGQGHLARLLAYCLLYTSPSPRDATLSRMPSSA